MGELAATSPATTSQRDVVRQLRRPGQRTCDRPGCPLPAQATLTFSYETRSALIANLADTVIPEGYDLCQSHADRTRPPRGWDVEDVRVDEPAAPDLTSDRTVAVLAAALRAEPVPPAVVAPDGDLLGDPADREEEPVAAIGAQPAPAPVRVEPADLPIPLAGEPTVELPIGELPADVHQPSLALGSPGWEVPAARRG